MALLHLRKENIRYPPVLQVAAGFEALRRAGGVNPPSDLDPERSEKVFGFVDVLKFQVALLRLGCELENSI